MKQITTIFFLVFAYILCFTTQAAAAKQTQSNNEPVELDFAYGTCSDIDDPLEGINRKIFMFNSVLDHFLLRPVAKGYNKMFDENTRDNIGNVFSNTKVPLTMVNNTLQGEGHKTLLSFWQFVINSTLGVAGSHDIAKSQGLHVEHQTFGSTLASYGFGPGPYIILPVLGMTNSRDMFDSLKANNIMNPINYAISDNTKLAITGGTLVTERADILPFTDHISKTSPDPYVSMRTAIHQRRESKVSYPSYYKCRNIKR